MASSENEDPADLFGEEGEGEDDLFGDEDESQSEQERALSDRELDSGDDEDRNDRARDRVDVVEEGSDTNDRQARIMDADFPRQVIPKPSDGQVSLESNYSKVYSVLISSLSCTYCAFRSFLGLTQKRMTRPLSPYRL
jgi:hypothetical protein